MFDGAAVPVPPSTPRDAEVLETLHSETTESPEFWLTHVEMGTKGLTWAKTLRNRRLSREIRRDQQVVGLAFEGRDGVIGAADGEFAFNGRPFMLE